MAHQNQSRGTSVEESEYFLFCICLHPLGARKKDIFQKVIEKWLRSQTQNDFIIHFCRDSSQVLLIPVEEKDTEQSSFKRLDIEQVNTLPDSCETLLISKTGTLHVLNDKEKAKSIVCEISERRYVRKIKVEDFVIEFPENKKSVEDIVSKQSSRETTRNEENKREVDSSKPFVLYFSLQRKYTEKVKYKPPNDEDFSVAERNKYKKGIEQGKKRNKNKDIKKRMSWHDGRNKVKIQISRDYADDGDLRENYFLEDRTVSVSPLKDGQKGKYSPELIKHLRDITNLPHDERPLNRITVQVYPGRRGKYSKPAYRRNRTHNSQAQEGIADQSPTQVSDAANESLNLPPAELVQTSARSIFQTFTNNSPAPTTNLMVSIDAERSLVNRLRGVLPENRFSRPQQPPRHQQYSDQPARLRSFSNWPSTAGQDPSRMAVYGFFYTGRFDLIRCFQCGIGLKDWAAPDEPLFEHIKHSPDCQFLKDLLGQDLLNAYRDNLLANQLNQATATSGSSTGNQTQATGRIRNPQYSEATARLRSFDKWPASSLQRPQALVDAGLFYTGFNDLCRCFTCDGGLQRWDADDDPWIEHARWFPHCNYVRQIKGQEYINMVQQAAAQAREEEQDPAVVYPPPGQRAGRGPVEQGISDLTLEDTNPLNTLAAQSVIGMGYSRRAVLLAIHEYNGQAHGERNDYTAGDLVRILTERQDRGEALPPDSPRDSYATPANVLIPENMDPEEENRRLKGILKCMQCEENDTNILFLPCTHHRMCEECAENAVICPICGRKIDEKIKTFMS